MIGIWNGVIVKIFSKLMDLPDNFNQSQPKSPSSINETYHRTLENSRLDVNTWSSLQANPFCSRTEWRTSAGTTGTWWSFWTGLSILPCDSVMNKMDKVLLTRNKQKHTQQCAYLILGLEQDLVVLGQRDQEDDRRHVLKAMNPFSSFRSLTANVNHSVLCV